MPNRESEIIPPQRREISVLSVLENTSESLETKAAIFEGSLLVPITRKRNYLARWETFVNKTPGFLDSNQTNKIVEKFLDFHNFRDKHPGEKAGHNTLTKFLYADYFLPALVSIREYAENSGDVQALKQSSLAMLVLNDALDILQTTDPQALRDTDQKNLLLMEQIGSAATVLEPFNNRGPVELAEVFPKLHLNSIFGSNTDMQGFYSLMAMARLTAYQCIAANCDKNIPLARSINPDEDLPKELIKKDFPTLCHDAQQYFLELQSGVRFPEDTLERIKRSRALVVSLDWNSVWNMKESYSNTHMISIAVEKMRSLSNAFSQKFPDKKILFVMNTGRPSHYAWGVIETLSVIKELRVIGLAESGGAILKGDMTTVKPEVPVPDSNEWKSQLDKLRLYLQSKVKNGKNDLEIEPKESTLSIRLAKKDTENTASGEWFHQDHQRQPINPDWIAKEVKSYLQQKREQLTQEIDSLTLSLRTDDQLGGKVLETLKKLGLSGTDGMANTRDDLTPYELKEIDAIFEEIGDRRLALRNEATKSLETINLMTEKLTSIYNPRAGFIDIGHSDFNKYSTLIRQVEKEFDYNYREVTVISVGDSQPDIIPIDRTGDGEVNRGADEALLVAVGNASPGLREAVEKRKNKNNRGIQTITPSILGLISIIKGLDKLITSQAN